MTYGFSSDSAPPDCSIHSCSGLYWRLPSVRTQAMTERKCEWCVWWRKSPKYAVPYCALERPLVPCDEYRREVGADDDTNPHNPGAKKQGTRT
jgi:hypothetical protein